MIAPRFFVCAAGAIASCAIAQSADLMAAQAAYDEGAFAESVERFLELLALDPDNSDLLRRLAAAQAATKDYDAALRTIDRASMLAPQDNDIRLARARILLWSGRREEAAQEAERVAAIAPDYPDLADLQRAIATARGADRRGGMALSVGVSSVDFASGASTSWKGVAAEGFFGIFPTMTLAARVDHEDRQQSDTRFGVRVDRRLPRGGAYFGFSATPHPDFRERWSIAAGGEALVAGRLAAMLDLRHAEYAANNITVVQPGFRIDATKRLAVTGRWINLFQSDGGYRSGLSGRVDLDLDGRAGLYAGTATYPDTEAGVTRQVRSVFAGAVAPLSGSFILRGGAEYERRAQSYTRRAVTIALDWRFGG